MTLYGLEPFSDYDNNESVAAVPTASSQKNVPFSSTVLGVDILTDIEFLYDIKCTAASASTHAVVLSPYFPYLIVNSLQVPYQSDTLMAYGPGMDGHTQWLIGGMRKSNRKYQASTGLGDQQPLLSTKYEATAAPSGTSTAGAYTWATLTAEEYKWSTRLPLGLWFDEFYDVVRSKNGKRALAKYNDVFVSPVPMSSSGRNITPKLTLSALATSSDVSASPLGQALGVDLSWVDNSSTVSIIRHGYRQPGANHPFPPIFNWAYNWQTFTFPLNGLSTVRIPIPQTGQLLSIIIKLFDPGLTSLATTVGDAIPLGNLSKVTFSYGAGITRWVLKPDDIRRLHLRQHGTLFTEGVIVLDLFADSRSNAEALNLYRVAGPQVKLEFGTAPGTSAKAVVACEYLSVVRR